MKSRRFLFLLIILGGGTATFSAEKIIRDITFAEVRGISLQLDLYLPATSVPAGLSIWVHGGAWRAGSRASVDLHGLADRC